MSPLTIERIKKAKGNIRIVPLASSDKFVVQIMENNVWVNVFTGGDRQLCEQVVRKATSQVILG